MRKQVLNDEIRNPGPESPSYRHEKERYSDSYLGLVPEKMAEWSFQDESVDDADDPFIVDDMRKSLVSLKNVLETSCMQGETENYLIELQQMYIVDSVVDRLGKTLNESAFEFEISSLNRSGNNNDIGKCQHHNSQERLAPSEVQMGIKRTLSDKPHQNQPVLNGLILPI
jgi:hypothetical protein